MKNVVILICVLVSVVGLSMGITYSLLNMGHSFKMINRDIGWLKAEQKMIDEINKCPTCTSLDIFLKVDDYYNENKYE
jgi:hypothetical protein